jgi:hypothetical protein
LGIINTITFTYLLNEYVGVGEDKIVSIVKILDPSNKNLINFMDFIRLVHDNTSLETMPLFKLGEKMSSIAAEQQKSDAERMGSAGDYRSEAAYFTPIGLGGPDSHMMPLLQPQKPPSGPDRLPATATVVPLPHPPQPSMPRSVTNLGN